MRDDIFIFSGSNAYRNKIITWCEPAFKICLGIHYSPFFEKNFEILGFAHLRINARHGYAIFGFYDDTQYRAQQIAMNFTDKTSVIVCPAVIAEG